MENQTKLTISQELNQWETFIYEQIYKIIYFQFQSLDFNSIVDNTLKSDGLVHFSEKGKMY